MLTASSQPAYPSDAFNSYQADVSQRAFGAPERRAASPLRPFGSLNCAFCFSGMIAAGGTGAGALLTAHGCAWNVPAALSAVALLACAVTGIWANAQIDRFQRGELAKVYATALQGPRRRVFDRRQHEPGWAERLGAHFAGLAEATRLAVLGKDKLRRWGLAVRDALDTTRPAAEALAAHLGDDGYEIANAMSACRRAEHELQAELTTFSQHVGEAAAANTCTAQEVNSLAEAVRAVTSHAEEATAESAKLANTIFAAQRSIASMGDVTASLISVADQVRAVLHRADVLGINAGIEAARAGDNGRSFSVVASEIKALAASGQAVLETMTQTVAALRSEAADIRETIAGISDAVQAQGRVGAALGDAASHQIEAIARVVRHVESASYEIRALREKSDEIGRRDLGLGPASSARKAVERLPAHADAVAKMLRDLPQFEDVDD